MPAPLYTVSDLLSGFLQLLPTGKAWNKTPSSNLYQVCQALMPTFQRVCARASYLLVDAFPASTVELLPQWEASLGLPDPCQGDTATTDQLRQQVVARFSTRGAPTVQGIIAFARNLGFSIEVIESIGFRANVSRANTLLFPVGAAYTLTIVSDAYITIPFRANKSTANNYLLADSNAVLECELRRFVNGHVLLNFQYTGAPGLLDDSFILDQSLLA